MSDQTAHSPPGWFTRNVSNKIVAAFTRAGVSIAGSRVLEVTGRKSGAIRRTPVNLLEFEGNRFLVAPRGQVEWVKNARVNPSAKLIKGGDHEEVTLVEVVDEADRVPLIRAYLKKWRWETGVFFGGVTADDPDEKIAEIAPNHPAFRVT